MSDSSSRAAIPPDSGRPASGGMWPTAPLSKAALVATVVSLGSWVVLPIITSLFAETVPITDTGVMPAIGVVLVDLAAAMNVLAVWWRKERAQMSVLALALTVVAALFFTFMVVGELLGGA